MAVPSASVVVDTAPTISPTVSRVASPSISVRYVLPGVCVSGLPRLRQNVGNLNGTSWNPDTRLASIRPGAHWQVVYDELAPHGVLVTGGRAGTVGTGGFISGGGNSFHSASHGMACDTVANFEVVLADGSIVNANASSNPDLWQALKGGSGNLGLITRFDMYPIEYPDPANPVIWGGNLLYDLQSGPAVIDALVDFTDNVYKDENSSSIVYWAYLPAILGGTILNAAIENTLATVKPPAFDGYYAVDGIYDDTTKIDTLSAVANELGSGQPSGLRYVMAQFTPWGEIS
jgi:hypothetical protein